MGFVQEPRDFGRVWRFTSSERTCHDFGFLDASLDFSVRGLAQSSQSFLTSFGLEDLYLLDQVHGTSILDLSEYQNFSERSLASEFRVIHPRVFQSIESHDALILPSRVSETGLAFGIRTADCIPLLICTKNHWALVHAGWRGVAELIVPKVLEALIDKGESDFEIYFGPHARVDSYEVGTEVLDALGTYVSYSPKGSKAMLDLEATVRNQIRSCLKALTAEIFSSEICTISNTGFHSYRRDSEASGRNLSFLCTTPL